MKWMALLLSLISVPASADQAFLGYGLGVFGSARHSPSETKILNLGYRKKLLSGIYWQSKVGIWGDGSGDHSRKSSGYGSSGLSLQVQFQPVEIRTGWSLAAISSPDSYLGYYFPQFNGELYLGVRDQFSNAIGVQYEHISSAGIVTPNQGRDFCTLQLSREF